MCTINRPDYESLLRENILDLRRRQKAAGAYVIKELKTDGSYHPLPGPRIVRLAKTRNAFSFRLCFLIFAFSMGVAVCGIFQHDGNTESRRSLEQKFIVQIGTLNPHGINERFTLHQ